MAIAFRASTQIASGGATDPMSAPALPATGGTTADGDMVLLFVIVKYASTTITTPTDWTLLNNGSFANSGLTDSGNDSGNIRGAIFWRIKDSSWSTMPAVDLSGTPNCTMRGAISYSKASDETWDTPEGAFAADNTADATGTAVDPAAASTTLDFGSGDLFGSFACQNGDAGTFSVHTFTVAGVTFGTSASRLGGTTSSGTDLRGHQQEKFYSSGTASAGPDGSMSFSPAANANLAGGFVFYRLRVTAGSTGSPAAVALTTSVPGPTATAGGDRTPAADALVLSIPNPTARQDASVTPAAVALSMAVPTPTLTATGERTPDPVALTMTVPGPTVTAGGDRTPDAVPLTMTVPTPTPAETISRTPDPVSLVTGVPAPTVTASGERTPDAVALAVALPTPTVTAGGDRTPSPVALALTVPNPTVTATALVTPSPVALVLGVPNPTVTAAASRTPAAVALSLGLPTPVVTASGSRTPSPVALVIALPTPDAQDSEAGSANAFPGPVSLLTSLLTPTVTATALITPSPVTLSLLVPNPTATGSGLRTPSPVQLVFGVPVPTATGDTGMFMFFGADEVDALRVGTTVVTKVYLGTVLVWSP